MKRKKRQPQTSENGADTLSQLLQREEWLARELDAAREEAIRLRREAAAYAHEKDAACDAIIRERTAQLLSAHQAQLNADLRSIEANAAAEARCFNQNDTALAKRLVALALESIGATRTVVPEASE